MLRIISFLLAASFLVSCAGSSDTTVRDGKPQARVELVGTLAGNTLAVHGVIQGPATNLVVTLKGIDGLTLQGGNARFSLPDVTDSAEFDRSVSFVTPVTDAMVAVVVTGTFDGRLASKVVGYHVPGTTGQATDRSLATADWGADGEPLEIFTAE